MPRLIRYKGSTKAVRDAEKCTADATSTGESSTHAGPSTEAEATSMPPEKRQRLDSDDGDGDDVMFDELDDNDDDLEGFQPEHAATVSFAIPRMIRRLKCGLELT
jgi:hypothetical protein